MFRSLMRNGVAWLAVGVVVGAVLTGSGLRISWETPLHAVATDRQENFAVATGWIDQDMEGVFFMDFLTGNLKAAVLNAKAGKFTAFYEQNILADLGVQPDKNPKFLMVTGGAALPTLPGGKRMGNSVVYIVEVTSGRAVAYAIPWVSGTSARGGPIGTSPLIKLDVAQFRGAAVRE
jgi:hypothetical protein